MPDQLRFLCPNGDKLAVLGDRAGKEGRCPKCGTKFRVPTAEQANTDGKLFRAEAVDDIVFLCPNGHKLNGPKKLAGRAGQCPHCGEKFQIPSLEELEAAASSVDHGDGHEGSTQMAAEDSGLQIEDIEAADSGQIDVSDLEVGEGMEAGELDYTLGDESTGDPLGVDEEPYTVTDIEIIDDETVGGGVGNVNAVFAELWGRRDEEHKFELHLTGGDVVPIERFAPRLSNAAHGVFAARDPEGGFVMTTVAWEAITRIVIHGVDELPEEMFD